ncbi:hypothetical protein CRM22_002907 [Opisthorchis felineus]|uniref:Uncharacterized protein n=1 Tax=Opisthorchis felineus TaxID=147828 RepID=A0A4S2M3Q8_OPIFE|nr:hypothetical protein CRM22_002907 [Opisthorchis felineus]
MDLSARWDSCPHYFVSPCYHGPVFLPMELTNFPMVKRSHMPDLWATAQHALKLQMSKYVDEELSPCGTRGDPLPPARSNSPEESQERAESQTGKSVCGRSLRV